MQDYSVSQIIPSDLHIIGLYANSLRSASNKCKNIKIYRKASLLIVAQCDKDKLFCDVIFRI